MILISISSSSIVNVLTAPSPDVPLTEPMLYIPDSIVKIKFVLYSISSDRYVVLTPSLVNISVPSSSVRVKPTSLIGAPDTLIVIV